MTATAQPRACWPTVAPIWFALANPGPCRYLFSQHALTSDPAGPPVSVPAFQTLAESISLCQQAGLARVGDHPMLAGRPGLRRAARSGAAAAQRLRLPRAEGY